MSRLRTVATSLLCLLSITQIYTQTKGYTGASPKREMRGIWIATVNNIDWPSAPDLSFDSLKTEANIILDRVKSLGLNTIFLQVRPSSDAIYPSELEPLSSYLTTTYNNKCVDNDLLEFWITEAHKRGLELHAWINPFRVTPKADFNCAANHISCTHPEWTITYAGKQYLNPGIPEARQYIIDVINDITSRYDIDGIHIDDYFYPYPVSGEPDFADASTFNLYRNDTISLADWRRENINKFIEQAHSTIKNIKPWIAFGVSPFGVWRNIRDDNRGSNTRAGITNYDILYADVIKWINNDWIDYVVPQIYWEAGNKVADFDELTKWWAMQNTQKSQIYVGHAIFKINTGPIAWSNPNEIPSQIEKVRSNINLQGSVFFSYRQFNRNLLGLEQTLQTSLYSNYALTPLRIHNDTSLTLRINHFKRKGNRLTWGNDNRDQTRFYAIYRYQKGDNFDSNKSNYLYDIVSDCEYFLKPSASRKNKYIYCVAPIDKYRKEHILSKGISVKQ